MTAGAGSRRRTASGWDIRWDEDHARAAYADGWWRKESCASLLRHAAVQMPARPILVDGSVSLTTARLYRQASALAHALRQRFAPGSVISFMLPNWHEAAIIYMGATMASMVVNPILPSLRDHDLRFILDDVRSRMLFIPASFRGHDYAAMMQRVSATLASPPDVVTVRDAATMDERWRALTEGDGPLPAPTDDSATDPDPDDVHMVMYTSGTTGRPKGVLHSHNSLNALIRQIGRHWLVDPGDRFLVPSPVSHIGGSIYAFEMPLMLGTTAVLMERWDAQEAVTLMMRHGCTHMAGATPFLQGLLGAARAAHTRLPDLKLFICGGASVPPALIREATDYFDRAIVSRVYGSTEVPVSTVGVIDHAHADHAADTDGRPGIASVRIAPDGEIRARGPQMMVGYLHAEDEANSFDEEGYYRTGDQGAWVDGDHLVVTGRIKDIIIRNGENIAPREIEDLLVGQIGIAEIAIVGLPDPATGERAVAVIVPDAGATPDLPAIRALLEDHGVARFKYPESALLWDSLPKNDAGKLLKQAIREKLLNGMDDKGSR